MIDVERLSSFVEEEIRDAGKYATCAAHCSEEAPEMAEIFHRLSGEELTHARLLFDAATEEVKRMQTLYKG